MTNKNIIHGEQVPIITLTRQQLEEDWYSLQNKLAREQAKNAELEAKVKELEVQVHYLDTASGELMAENKKLAEINAFKHTLSQIKEVAEKAVKDKYTTKSDEYSEGMYRIGLKILELIKEVR